MVDEIFDALAAEFRRELLLELLDYSPQRVSRLTGVSWTVAESDDELLRKHLASSREIDDADEDLLRQHHVHLPKLDDYGFIEWDRDADFVTKGPRFDEIRPFLELLDGRRDDLPAGYLRDLEALRIVSR